MSQSDEYVLQSLTARATCVFSALAIRMRNVSRCYFSFTVFDARRMANVIFLKKILLDETFGGDLRDHGWEHLAIVFPVSFLPRERAFRIQQG